MKKRLDRELVEQQLTTSRSQAENYIKLGYVSINGVIITKAGFLVSDDQHISIHNGQQYVSRAGLKLASISQLFKLDFNLKSVLDVGSSTGGFTDYALKQGAHKVIAVEVGSNQLHESLRLNKRIELYEKTDIRQVYIKRKTASMEQKDINKVIFLDKAADIILIDVSFISLRSILPHIADLSSKDTIIIAMLKPQFEATENSIKHKGVIKNNNLRRTILKDFEQWCRKRFIIINKADSAIKGAKGNIERFYYLKIIK